MPALLTRMSTPPKAATTAATPSLTAFSSVTSMAIPIAWPPLARISFAVAPAASLLRSAIATFAPSRAYTRAMSLPMPLAAPVTIADLSLSLISPLICRNGSGREIEYLDAVHALGRAMPARVGARTPQVLETSFPELAHRRSREFVVLRARRVREAPIDEVHNSDVPLALA